MGLYKYTFKSDGSFIYNYISGTYEINENGTVILYYNSVEDTNSLLYSYEFTKDETVLTFYDVETLDVSIILNKI